MVRLDKLRATSAKDGAFLYFVVCNVIGLFERDSSVV